MLDLTKIPTERLAMLDNMKLYGGSHGGGTGGPDCKHCARELLYEVVTGNHADEIPPGCSIMIGVLPTFNDGPWLNDDHRTQVMRPYLKKMLALDPAKDAERVFYLLDHVYRADLPTICDLFKEHEAAKKLRGLAKIVDNESAIGAIDALGALHAIGALDALGALRAIGALRTLRALGALGALRALDALHAIGTLGALHAIGTFGALRALDALDKKQIAEAWEKNCTDALDLICSI